MSTQYQVTHLNLATKYRPTSLRALHGQKTLVCIIENSIKYHRIENAYLLSGIRGVGKTSVARIIAKLVNCTSINNDSIIACEQCDNCVSMNNIQHPDIIEIDAASKTGVDDIKSLIESASYKPLLGKYKVFIIDEVHMLSKNAFNALLKTLEEPPAHSIFILATTEIHKVPVTVISRCQRHDLRRLEYDDIYSLLENICNTENIRQSVDGLSIIANKSEGSARDALSLLDQVLSYIYGNNIETINAQSVNQALGIIGIDLIIYLFQLILSNSPKKIFELNDKIYNQSLEIGKVVISILDFIVHLTKLKLVPEYTSNVYDNYREEINKILLGVSLSRLTILYTILNKGYDSVTCSLNQKSAFDMLMIQCMYFCDLPAIPDTHKVDTIDQKVDVRDQLYSNLSSLLKFCKDHNEISLYYSILNDVEFTVLKDGIAKINYIDQSICDDLKQNITKIMKSWSGVECQIEFTPASSIISFKEYMMNIANRSEDYQLVKKYFPDSDISDIFIQ